MQLFANVILENHLHLIASAPDLSIVMRHFKSFTARQIIALLQQRGVQVLLQRLQALKLRHKKESTYQLWQEGSHPQEIRDDEMMRQ